MSNYTLKITSAVAIDGKIHKPGAEVSVGESLAKDLLRRGKAKLAVEPAPESKPAPVVSAAQVARVKAGGTTAEPEPTKPAKGGK